MAINYSKVGWSTSSYVNPTNMDKMDSGIKSACDGVDALNALDLDNRLKANGYSEGAGGRNLWDEVWEVGTISPTNGENREGSGTIRSLNLIECNAATVYSLIRTFSATRGFYIYFYDSSRAYISYVNTTPFTTPSNCKYVRFAITYYIQDNATYKNDIAIIEGTSGTYEPYYSSNKTLTESINEQDSLKMLGWTVPAEYTGPRNYTDSNGIFHQRVGRVDLGSLSWGYSTSDMSFQSEISNIIKPTSSADRTKHIMCAIYTANDSPVIGSGVNKTITQYQGTKGIYVNDFSYTDATAFRTAMSGIYLYYELATEVTKNVDGNEVISKSGIDKLQFSVSGTTLTITNGTTTWTINAQ